MYYNESPTGLQLPFIGPPPADQRHPIPQPSPAPCRPGSRAPGGKFESSEIRILLFPTLCTSQLDQIPLGIPRHNGDRIGPAARFIRHFNGLWMSLTRPGNACYHISMVPTLAQITTLLQLYPIDQVAADLGVTREWLGMVVTTDAMAMTGSAGLNQPLGGSV